MTQLDASSFRHTCGKFAGIEEKVVIIGVGDSFEIWAPERLEAEENANSDPKANADRWAMFNINTRGN